MELPKQKQAVPARRASASALIDSSARLALALTPPILRVRSLESLLSPPSANGLYSTTSDDQVPADGNEASTDPVASGYVDTRSPSPPDNRTIELPLRPHPRLSPLQEGSVEGTDAEAQPSPTPETATVPDLPQSAHPSPGQSDDMLIEQLPATADVNDAPAQRSEMIDTDDRPVLAMTRSRSSNEYIPEDSLDEELIEEEPATPWPTSDNHQLGLQMPALPDSSTIYFGDSSHQPLRDARLLSWLSSNSERLRSGSMAGERAGRAHAELEDSVSAPPHRAPEGEGRESAEKQPSEKQWKKQLKKVGSKVKKGWLGTKALSKRFWHAFLLWWCGFENGEFMGGWR